MNTIDDNIIKRKGNITATAWVSLVVSVVVVIYSTAQLIINIFRDIMITEAMEHFKEEQFNSARQGMFQVLHNNYLVYSLLFCSALIYLIIAIGLLRSKNWARISYMIVSCILMVASVSFMVYYIRESMYMISTYSDQISSNPIHSRGEYQSSMIMINTAAYTSIVLFVNRLLYQVLLLFRKEEYKSLFE